MSGICPYCGAELSENCGCPELTSPQTPSERTNEEIAVKLCKWGVSHYPTMDTKYWECCNGCRPIKEALDTKDTQISELKAENDRLQKKLDETWKSKLSDLKVVSRTCSNCHEVEASNAELRAEVERLNTELAQQKTKTHCAYCGEDFLLDTVTAEQVGEHIQNCPKHPIADYKEEISSLKSLIQKRTEALKIARSESRHLSEQEAIERFVRIHKAADEALTEGSENA